MAEEEDLEGVATDEEDLFASAASFLAAAVTSKDPRFHDKLKLQFYGLYKQVTSGKCAGGRPGFWDVAGRAKWDAWAQLGDLPKASAMTQYVELLQKVVPEWGQGGASGSQPKAKGTMGPVFSCLAAGEEAGDGGGQAAGPKTLQEVAGEGDVDAVAGMLDAGEAVDCRDESDCTALHFAADRGSAQVARLLIGSGADVNARDADGQTPLHYAAITDHREVYDILVEAGADVSIQDSQGTTAADNAPAAWGLA
ncbi:Acyl-CoA binding domain containing 5 [Pleodorina starrii]|uniref:Acyl-CoA binding domain containing 5 n=1 Tax=Pleodorina starrii TaxID=330485 RepID=A0A9W6BJQ5_9CHLO|nr:Acyl-CoA binding domain containing 5 [Pleodorina starrii]GLC53253.1 Acyl-CoA binding domain containing 5 [Pleodorina starrii]GLC68112.1 Acyl-CoA binding domain containing 5 [Pleodorina starrii]